MTSDKVSADILSHTILQTELLTVIALSDRFISYRGCLAQALDEPRVGTSPSSGLVWNLHVQEKRGHMPEFMQSRNQLTTRRVATCDGNKAEVSVAYRLNEVIAIFPITPASPMGEWADAWSSTEQPNIWGTPPTVVEVQSEAGAAGAVHGALQAGALTTTFTASQGLLLILPNMYKIAGELTATVFHVAARSVAAQALTIFCDHSDVMAARATGFALLASGSVQEAMDFALIAQATTLAARVPLLPFFDGFRTSHEIATVDLLSDENLRARINDRLTLAHRARALSPDHPFIRGTAQNPDVFFQARETVNPYYAACPELTQQMMDRLAQLTGRSYQLFEYHGAPDAERIVVLMGSGAEAVHETVDALHAQGEKVGVVKVRLYCPFDMQRFVQALPATTRAMAILDRTKEPGSAGEPLYLDCMSALHESRQQGWGHLEVLPTVIGGRYGLGSKEFNPAMIKGIFVYDAKKAGSATVSHLRFGPRPIRSTYQITRANFVACHQPVFLERYDMLQHLAPGGTFLLNSPHGPDASVGSPASTCTGASHRQTGPLLCHRRLSRRPRQWHEPAH